MADIILREDQPVPGGMNVRYKDMNNGTHALVVAAGLDESSSDILSVQSIPAPNLRVVSTITTVDLTGGASVPTAGSYVEITPPDGCASVSLQIMNMPGSCQLNFEGTVNGVNWEPVDASNGTATVNATAGADIFILPGAAYAGIRVRATVWAGGTANITFLASIGTSASILTGAIPAGTNTIGGTFARPETTGGLTVYRTLDLDETGQLVSTGAHQLYGYYIYNNANAARYVKIYNHVDAPVAGDTPLITIGLAANSAANLASASLASAVGIAFSAGIGLRATTGVADADTGAPAGNDIVANLWYK
jgi:hypothetical protein